jgi:aminoglycoside phosphotransferase (APT) family kinase protein
MGGAEASPAVELHEDDLVLTVAELLTPSLGRDVRVEAVRRERSPFATLFPADVLDVSVAGGPPVRLFLKHLGPEQPGQPDKGRRDREVLVYQNLLGDERLPVPRFYGSRLNRRTGRLELYLEYVDDWNLKYHDLEQWFAAARRLAQLHAHFAGRAGLLRSCDFLLVLDRDYFTRWARRAGEALAEQSADLAAELEQVLREYGRVGELLERQAPTLVHNDLAPKNVIPDRSSPPTRIRFIDWEMAGIGCGLLDLVHLKYGLDPPSDREMVAAYRRELRAAGLPPVHEGEFEHVLAACELHKTLYRLAHSPAWRLPPVKLRQWVTEAKAFLEEV